MILGFYSLRGVNSKKCDVSLKNCPVLGTIEGEDDCFEFGRMSIESSRLSGGVMTRLSRVEGE